MKLNLSALLGGLTIVGVSAFAAAPAQADYYVLADNVDNCSVSENESGPGMRKVAGPYATEAEAEAAMKDNMICEEGPNAQSEMDDDSR